MRYFVDFQSDTISQKTKIGMNEAKQKGVISGRPRKSEVNVQTAIEMYESKKYSLADIKEKTGISKSSLSLFGKLMFVPLLNKERLYV